MEKIPVTFDLKGTTYKGELSLAHGAAGQIWHLMVDGFYFGQLENSTRGWQFSTQKYGYDPELAEFFGNCIISWIDSHSV